MHMINKNNMKKIMKKKIKKYKKTTTMNII